MADAETNRESATKLMTSLRQGDRQALDSLSDLMYQELKRIASSHLRRERPGHTLQPTALVHELYLRMAAWGGDLENKSRAHFFATAAVLMRQILVGHARRRNASKRGGGRQRITLDDGLGILTDGSSEVAALDDALNELAKGEERKAKVIELRYFGGLMDTEIAEVLGISVSTVGREVKLGLALLRRQMRGLEEAAP